MMMMLAEKIFKYPIKEISSKYYFVKCSYEKGDCILSNTFSITMKIIIGLFSFLL